MTSMTAGFLLVEAILASQKAVAVTVGSTVVSPTILPGALVSRGLVKYRRCLLEPSGQGLARSQARARKVSIVVASLLSFPPRTVVELMVELLQET